MAFEKLSDGLRAEKLKPGKPRGINSDTPPVFKHGALAHNPFNRKHAYKPVSDTQNG